MFLHVSVILSMGWGGLQAHTLGEVEGFGQGGTPVHTQGEVGGGGLAGGGFSRPIPRGEVEGSGRGVSRPIPGGGEGWEVLLRGASRPRSSVVGRSRPRWGCIPACTEVDTHP